MEMNEMQFFNFLEVLTGSFEITIVGDPVDGDEEEEATFSYIAGETDSCKFLKDIKDFCRVYFHFGIDSLETKVDFQSLETTVIIKAWAER